MRNVSAHIVSAHIHEAPGSARHMLATGSAACQQARRVEGCLPMRAVDSLSRGHERDTMSDQHPAGSPPPLPRQSAAEAARAAETARTGRPAAAAHVPGDDPDDTGVPATDLSDAGATSRSFLAALFDLSFRTFITRRLASVFYFVGLVAIGIGFLVYFVGGVVRGSSLIWLNPGAGVSAIVATVVIVPVLTLLAIILLRFVIEGVVALIAIAENTERTAENTRR